MPLHSHQRKLIAGSNSIVNIALSLPHEKLITLGDGVAQDKAPKQAKHYAHVTRVHVTTHVLNVPAFQAEKNAATTHITVADRKSKKRFHVQPLDEFRGK